MDPDWDALNSYWDNDHPFGETLPELLGEITPSGFGLEPDGSQLHPSKGGETSAEVRES